MLFGMYLVENGVIDADEFYEALKYQLNTRPQLGTLAVERGMLTLRQVFTVLQAQVDSPTELFGDIAARLGFLSDEEVVKLLQEQSTRMTPFFDVLVELDVQDWATLEAHQADYHALMERSMSVDEVLLPT